MRVTITLGTAFLLALVAPMFATPAEEPSFRGMPPAEEPSFRGMPPAEEPSFRGMTSAQESSFLGEWTATAETPGGGVSETITAVKTDKGYTITVKLVQPPPEGTPQAGPGTDIVLNGDKFSYKRSISTPDGTLVITYSGVVSGDTFTGTVDLGGFAQAPYTGVRIKR